MGFSAFTAWDFDPSMIDNGAFHRAEMPRNKLLCTVLRINSIMGILSVTFGTKEGVRVWRWQRQAEETKQWCICSCTN
jgi:hypothetical protein